MLPPGWRIARRNDAHHDQRVIIDTNARIGHGARLVNERHIEHADGIGYYIRDGIIVVPKGGAILQGMVV